MLAPRRQPDLKIGTTLELLKQTGNMLVSKDKLNKKDYMLDKGSIINFKILLLRLWTSLLGELDNFDIIEVISCGLVGNKKKCRCVCYPYKT